MGLFFRGQVRKNGQKVRMDGAPVPGKWVFGSGAFQGSGAHSIIYGGTGAESLGKFAVYTETLCQYIGMDDKNNVEIFTYDILEIKGIKRKWLVMPDAKRFRIVLVATDNHAVTVTISGLKSENVWVVGNVFDNADMVTDLDAIKEEFANGE